METPPYISKAFYKSASFIVNAAAVAVGLVPDAINLILENWTIIDGLPTLSPERKLYLFGAANLIAMLLRTVKQKSIEKAAIEQATEEGKVVPLPASGVSPVPSE
jgi:hypothetical protein